MPASDPVARNAAVAHILAGKPGTVLDIGPGLGLYGAAIKDKAPQTRMIGVEIWGPYVTPQLRKWYDEVWVSDCRCFDYTVLAPVDCLAAGDVLEHMARAEAVALVARWKAWAPWIVASIPIQRVEQGPYQGNPHEAHLYQWTREEVERDLGLALVKDCGICGLFEWRRPA